jgi:oligopeptide transport system ATP-binding protein
MNDTAYNQAYDAKMAEYKKEYAGLTAKEITDETRKRNEILAKEIYLSVGRYKLRKKVRMIKKLHEAFKAAMECGVDLNDDQKRNSVFDQATFRVRYLDETPEQLHGTCIINLAKIQDPNDWGQIRGKKIATVFQDPMTSLNPIITIGKQITSVIMKHQNVSEVEARAQALELMEKVGIPNAEQRFDDYPFQYSGGMRQRIVIAIALSCRPKILICDEPTTALDVTIQAQILKLIKDLQKEYNYTIVFITHDLGVVANIADRVAVLYAGQIIEFANVEELFYDPRHPYTWALLSSLPQLAERNTKLFSITGTPPSLYNKIIGDPFAPRNQYCLKIDTLEEPPMFKVTDTHYAKTWLLDPRAPKTEKPEAIQNIHEKLLKAYKSLKVSTKQESKTTVSHLPEHGPIDENGREILLQVKNVDITFGKGDDAVKAVKNASFDIYKGETFSLVGESGSGKTTIGRAVIRVNPCSAGEILYKGVKISGKIPHSLDREVIRNIQMVFQDPAASLNERATVDYIVSEGLYNFHLYENEADRVKKVENMINEVGLLPEHLTRYPHEFSGGQRQRIGLARAMVMEPELVVADEPISALDVSIRAQVLNLLKKFQREKQVTYLFIAHDLSIVRFISDRIGVIYKGNIVEVADAEELFNFPLHPYTHSLISAIPIPDPQLEKNKVLYTYDPSIHDYSVDKPEFVDIGHNHFVYGNKKEIEEYKALREKGEPLQPITIRKPGEEVKEENHEVHLSKAEDEFLKTPVHDTGSVWYKVLSFFFPIIGIIAAMVYKKKQYYHNYKACKQGALYGFAVLAVILLIFIIALILVAL